jgi:hypothetical protein
MTLNMSKHRRKKRHSDTNNFSSIVFDKIGISSAQVVARLEQTTSSAPVISKTKVWLGKYLKKSCLFEQFEQVEQCFFKCFPNYVVRFSRQHCQKSKMATLGLNELNSFSSCKRRRRAVRRIISSCQRQDSTF